jgi:hypothetical protein
MSKSKKPKARHERWSEDHKQTDFPVKSLLEDEPVVAPGWVRVVANLVAQDIPQKFRTNPTQHISKLSART